jgi:hypothetical protein
MANPALWPNKTRWSIPPKTLILIPALHGQKTHIVRERAGARRGQRWLAKGAVASLWVCSPSSRFTVAPLGGYRSTQWWPPTSGDNWRWLISLLPGVQCRRGWQIQPWLRSKATPVVTSTLSASKQRQHDDRPGADERRWPCVAYFPEHDYIGSKSIEEVSPLIFRVRVSFVPWFDLKPNRIPFFSKLLRVLSRSKRKWGRFMGPDALNPKKAKP